MGYVTVSGVTVSRITVSGVTVTGATPRAFDTKSLPPEHCVLAYYPPGYSEAVHTVSVLDGEVSHA